MTRYVTISAIIIAQMGFCDALYSQQFDDTEARYAYIGAGNVEIKQGIFTYGATDLSVGAGSFPNKLVWRREINPDASEEYYGTRIDFFNDNWVIRLGCRELNVARTECISQYVRIGGDIYLFLKSGNSWISKYGDGSSLVLSAGNWNFRTKNGDLIIFPDNNDNYIYGSTGPVRGARLPTTWRFSDGNSLIFTYEYAYKSSSSLSRYNRLTKIVNALGYGFSLTYLDPAGGDIDFGSTGLTGARKLTIKSVTTINPACASSVNISCNTGSHGSVTYNYSNRNTAPGPVQIDSMIDAVGKVTNFSWHNSRSIRSQTNPDVAGSFLFQTEIVDGAVTKLTDAAGHVWKYRRIRDNIGNVISAEVEDPQAAVTKYGFSVGRVAPDWIEDPTGARTKYTYDSFGRIGIVENPRGAKIVYDYDDRANLIKKTTLPSPAYLSDQNQLEETYLFPACDAVNWKICNKPILITDSRGGQTEIAYNVNHGGVETILGPGSTTERSLIRNEYITSVRAPGVEDPLGGVLSDISLISKSIRCLSTNGSASYVCPSNDAIETSYAYVSSTASTRRQFLLKSTTVAYGTNIAATSTYKYDVRGNVIEVDGPRSDSDITYLSYDNKRRLTKFKSPDPDGSGALVAPETNYEYDTVDNITKERRRLGTADQIFEFKYNSGLQLIQAINPTSGTINYSYDSVGRLEDVYQTVDGQVRRSRNVYDAAGRLTAIRSGVGSAQEQTTAAYGYAVDGSMSSVTDAGSNVTNYCYDGFGRMVELRYPSPALPGTSVSCSAVPAGGLSADQDFESYHYDAAGNVISMRLRDGQSIGLQYDSLNRLKFKDVPEADRDVTYKYDLVGRIKEALLPGPNAGLSVTWSYDKRDRIISTTTGGVVVNYSYDLGNTWRDIQTPGGPTWRYTSDTIGRIRNISEVASGKSLATYTFDQLSRLTSILRNSRESTYSYYPLSDRLNSINHNLAQTANDVTLSYTYNDAGQIKSKVQNNDGYSWNGHYNVVRAYDVNGLNQYTGISLGEISPSYDNRGNMTSAGPRIFTYDSENHLIAAGGDTSVSLRYDAIDRLYEVKKGSNITRFLYDGLNLVAEYDGLGNVLRRYAHGPGSDEPVVWYEGSGTTDRRWLMPDERGSIVAVSDSVGQALGINSYDQWGIPQSTNLGRFQYTGQAWIPELELYYYKARFYSATLGRFLQPDPIGYAGGMNLYNYAANDPVNAVDPLGLQPTCPSGVVCGSTTTTPPGGSSGSNQGGTPLPGAVDITGGFLRGYGSLAGLVANAPGSFATTGPAVYREQILPQSGNCTQSNRGGCQEKQLPNCAQDFLRGRIVGDPANIRFRRGGSIFNVFGNSVTYGSTIHLAGSSFFRTDAAALIHKFHEIAHTSQNARLGLSSLHHAAGYAAFVGHDASPLEQSADDFAQATFGAYQKAGLDKTCPF